MQAELRVWFSQREAVSEVLSFIILFVLGVPYGFAISMKFHGKLFNRFRHAFRFRTVFDGGLYDATDTHKVFIQKLKNIIEILKDFRAFNQIPIDINCHLRPPVLPFR